MYCSFIGLIVIANAHAANSKGEFAGGRRPALLGAASAQEPEPAGVHPAHHLAADHIWSDKPAREADPIENDRLAFAFYRAATERTDCLPVFCMLLFSEFPVAMPACVTQCFPLPLSSILQFGLVLQLQQT